MMKVTVLILLLVVVLAKSETSFTVISNNAKSFNVTPKKGYTVSYPEGYVPSRKQQKFQMPIDIGGNFGDNLWFESRKDENDTLALREIWVNKVERDNMLSVNWQVILRNKKINRIRFLNIGRERAFVEKVTGLSNGGPEANALVHARKGHQFRLLIEVYTMNE